MEEELIRGAMKWTIIIGFVAWAWFLIIVWMRRKKADDLVPITLDMGEGRLIENGKN